MRKRAAPASKNQVIFGPLQMWLAINNRPVTNRTLNEKSIFIFFSLLICITPPSSHSHSGALTLTFPCSISLSCLSPVYLLTSKTARRIYEATKEGRKGEGEREFMQTARQNTNLMSCTGSASDRGSGWKTALMVSAFPSPADMKAICLAWFNKGKVKVILSGGGLGESVMAAIQRLSSWRKKY